MRIISGFNSQTVVEEAKKAKLFNNEIEKVQYQMINIDGKPFYSVLIY